MDKRIIMIAALALAAVACGDDDDKGDSDKVVIRSDASIGQPDASINNNIDSSIPSVDSGAQGDGSRPVVKGAPGCFSGTPTTNVQFLNSCAEGYREFDNAARLPGYTKGQPLPAL